MDPRTAALSYLSQNLPAHIVEGIDWNIQDESGWNPGINEANPLVPGSRGGYGIYQLTGPRRKQFESWAPSKGYTNDNARGQAQFLMHELNTTERAAYDKLLKTKTPQEAAEVFARDFLRPSKEHLDRRVAKYTGGNPSMSSRNPLEGFFPQGAQNPIYDDDSDIPMFDPGPSTGDKIRQVLAAASGAFGGDFTATDAFIDQMREARLQPLGMGAMGGNATIEAIRRLNPELAAAVEAGAMDPQDAYKMAYEQSLEVPSTAELNEDQLKAANTFRDEATKEIAIYNETRRAYNQMGQSGGKDTGAGDLALATGFMKMLDPGSVVRESELAISLNSGGALDTLLAKVKGQLDEGQRMDPETRQKVIDVANDLYEFERNKAEQSMAYWGDIAGRQGISTDFIARPLPERMTPFDVTQPAAAAAAGPRAIAPETTTAPAGEVLTFNQIPRETRQTVIQAMSNPNGPDLATLDALADREGWSDAQVDAIIAFFERNQPGAN